MVNYQRCFAFGCSYTQYIWPTVADLIGCNFDEYYNFGKAGADNTYALNRLIDTHATFTLNPKTDLVLFGVTGHGRFSYWDENNDWVGEGEYNFSENQPDKFLSRSKYNPVWSVYRSINAIRNFKYLLSAWKIPHILFPAIDNAPFCLEDVYKKDRKDFSQRCMESSEDILNLLDVKTSMDEYMMDTKQFHTKTYFRKENRIETHPTPKIHHEYLIKFFPKFDTERVKNIVKEFDYKVYEDSESLQNIMAKKFCLLYRKDMYVDTSLFLEKSEKTIGWIKKFQDNV